MNFQDKIVIAILLLIARRLCSDEEAAREIKNIANRVQLYEGEDA
jgi:hypothetical protein